VEPSFYIQLLLNGIVIGVIYALIAMGLSLIFGVLEIVNFAHGEFYMFGAMLAYFLSTNVGLGYWTTILGVTALAVSLGYVLYDALYLCRCVARASSGVFC
jgi:branched-chain amino acid transport system permease protein